MALAGSNRKPALTAAVSKISYSRATTQKLKEEPWQVRAWQVYEAEGSIYFMTRYRSAVARKIDYYAARILEPGDDPDLDATFNEEGEMIGPGEASKVLEAEGGPELLRRIVSELMVHWDVPGEAYLTRFNEEPFWRILSTQELKKQDDQYLWMDDNVEKGTVDSDAVYRVWKPHPRFHWQADSPTKHVLEDAEELILLRRELKARSQSRLPAGAWILPDTVDFTPFGQDEAGTEDDFARELTSQMTQAVSDPGSAAAQVPWVLTVSPADHPLVVGGFINFHRDWEVPMEQREALLRAIATGLDVPPEILTGMADLNHWSAWLVSEQAVSQHVGPTVDDILDSLTHNWFRPLLAAASVDPDRYVLWRDLSPATVPPDRTDTALAMFKEGVISDIAVRRVSDFDEEDAPEQVEGETPPMEADELLKRINAFGTLRRAGAEWEDAVKAVGLPPITQIPGLLPITVRAEGVVQNEEAVVSGVQAAVDEPIVVTQSWLDAWLVDTLKSLKEGGPPLAEAAVTAATRRRVDAKPLADIDRELLAWLVNETQTEIDRLLGVVEKSLTAASDPLDETLLARFRSRVEKKITEAQAAARSWVERLTGRVTDFVDEAQTRSVGLDLIVGGVLEAIRRRLFTPGARPDPIDTGRLPDTLPPTDILRRGLTVAGGGKARFEDAATVDMIGNGQRIHDELEANGFRPELFRWVYGHPKNSFEPHRRLSGVEFDSWESPKLAVSVDGSWVGGSHFRPGDHRGCQCSFEQVLVLAAGSQPSGVRPEEPTPAGPPLTWEQFGVKLPTDSARRQLLNDALQRLNGLEPGVRDRYVQLLGQFDAGIKFRVATASTKSIRELGKVTLLTDRRGTLLPHGRELSLHLSRETDEWGGWVKLHNAEHRRLASQVRGPGAPSHSQLMDEWKQTNPEPPHWRLASPDELADTLVHELGHANDYQQYFDTGTNTMAARLDKATRDRVWEMYWGGPRGSVTSRNAAYEYATTSSAEMVAELQRFYLRGVHDEGLNLTAVEWRMANSDLARWVEENLLP